MEEVDMVYLVEESFADMPFANNKQLMNRRELQLSYPAVFKAIDALERQGFTDFIIDITKEEFNLKIIGEPEDSATETVPI